MIRAEATMRRAGVLLGFCWTSLTWAAPADHSAWDALLTRYVLPAGIDYTRWQSAAVDREALRTYLRELQTVAVDSLARDEQLAFWINLYNATTVQLVLGHYPTASFRDIGGPEDSPWKQPVIRIGRRELSLDAIEHEIVRPQFGDARIHFALNCAAASCPPLLNAAYQAQTLDAQLDAVTRAALNDSRFVDARECAARQGSIRLSRIFEWYAGDFGDVVDFLNRYRAAPLDPGCRIEFMDYDWALNTARPPK
jgi:hypothetical protein